MLWKEFSFLKSLLRRQTTYSMEQSSSWEANSFSASQRIPRILWKPKVHYRFHKSLKHVPVVNHIRPVYVHHPTSRRFILILFSHLRGSSKLFLLSGFATKTPHAPLLSPFTCYVSCQSQSSLKRLKNRKLGHKQVFYAREMGGVI